MELSAKQRQRRVRMALAAMEMAVLAALPRAPDAMQRYTACVPLVL